MSEEKKPLTLIEWIKQEMNKEDYGLSDSGIQKVLDGEETSYEDSVIDMILNLEEEYAERGTIYPDGSDEG